MTALSTALLALSLAGSGQADAAKFRLAWVDIISEDTGSWLNYDLPMLGATPGTVGMRFLYQVQPVWGLPINNLYVGTSLQAQTLHYERTMKFDIGPGDVGWFAGAHTRLFMPSGAMAGLRWKTTRARLALGASAVSPSTWRRPGYKTWSVMPTLGFSIVLGKPEPGERFEAQPIERIERPVQPAEAAEGESVELPEGAVPERAEGTAGESVELPEGETEGGSTQPDEVILPESEVESAAPTGPTQVEFSAPTQVVIPGSEPTQVEFAEEGDEDEDEDEEAPTRVVLPDDESSQSDDK